MEAANENFPFRPSDMDREAFVLNLGGVYEHSPWIAETLFKTGLTGDHDSAVGLHAAMRAIVDRTDRQQKLELLRAHPDLAGRLAIQGNLTADSNAEQASAGLDQCTPEEYAAFQSLNERYKEKFGFPFILAVRGLDRGGILANFQERVDNDPETEFNEAVKQVHRIAFLRIENLFRQNNA